MNHYTWVYVAGGGRNYPVGLFHGPKTGHLLIYIGSKITTIDFKVFDSKEYTFFIEDELCHIKLERRGGEMFYFFNIDKQADTPRNRARNALERKFFKQLLISIGVMALLVTAFVFWQQQAKKSPATRIEEMLAKNSRETIGKISLKTGASKPDISYQFVAGNQSVTSPSLLQSETLILLANSMPLEPGDEFTVRYSPARPEVNQILFSRPSERQIEVYKQRAATVHDRLHPGAPPGMTACFMKTAFEFNGVKALADIYFQGTKPAYNLEHNQETFAALTTNRLFLDQMEQACGHLKPQN
ncbi:MAG: hypothetical protein HY842_04760 [Bacteroidetes bacterium]|nr:hypothetical protein [Bacteroidota bacterium]